MHKTEVMKRPPCYGPPTTLSKGEQRTVFCLSQSNEKRHCQCWGVLCINTDGLLGCCATHHKSYLEDRGRRSQSETDRESEKKNERKEGRKEEKQRKKESVSVWMSAKLMCITVQDLSKLTAKCNLTGNRALWTQVLGLQFHCTLCNLFSWQSGNRNIAWGFDLAVSFSEIWGRYCHQLNSLSQTPYCPSHLTEEYYWLIVYPELRIWTHSQFCSCVGLLDAACCHLPYYFGLDPGPG